MSATLNCVALVLHDNPLMSLIPGLIGSLSAPQIVELAKRFQACGCDLTKLAQKMKQ